MILEMEPWAATVLLSVGMASAWLVGWRWARWDRAKGRPEPEGKLEEASLALLGLLLAFTFSMALTRYDRRRETLITDSNAIGDFYTCASLSPESVRPRLQSVIREYTQLRVNLAISPSQSAVDTALPQFDQLQGRMTDLVREALAAGTPIAVPLTQTLNGVTSSHASRLAAIRDRVPHSIVLLLLLASILNALLVGRQQGAAPRPSIAATEVFLVIVTLTVWVTLDLSQPFGGLIRLSQEPLQRLLGTMTP